MHNGAAAVVRRVLLRRALRVPDRVLEQLRGQPVVRPERFLRARRRVSWPCSLLKEICCIGRSTRTQLAILVVADPPLYVSNVLCRPRHPMLTAGRNDHVIPECVVVFLSWNTSGT